MRADVGKAPGNFDRESIEVAYPIIPYASSDKYLVSIGLILMMLYLGLGSLHTTGKLLHSPMGLAKAFPIANPNQHQHLSTLFTILMTLMAMRLYRFRIINEGWLETEERAGQWSG